MQNNIIEKFLKKWEYELASLLFLLLKILFKAQTVKFNYRVLAAICFSVFLALVIGRLLRKTDEKMRKGALVLFAFFICGPIPDFIFFPDSFVEIYPWYPSYAIYKNLINSLCVILAAITIDKKDSRWDIPILCFICMWRDSFFLLSFFPIILIMLFYRLNSAKFSKDYRLLTVMTLGAVGLGLWFFKGERMELPTNLSFSVFVNYHWRYSILNLVRGLPLVILMTAIWINALLKSRDKWFKATVVLILLEGIFPFIALLFIDNYMDLTMSALFAQFVLMALFLHSKEEEFLPGFRKILGFLESNLFAAGLILAYLAAFAALKMNPRIIDILAG